MTSGYANWNQNIIDEFRASGGTVTTGGFGRALVLLHHRGARSGVERVSPVRAIPDGPDTWLIAASKGGAPDNPAWYHNLLANPDTTIETPDEGVVAVRAVNLDGAERDAGWEQFKAASEGFRSYEEKTSRTIPVLALHRR
jgi:deazaflavin-dependent oxidoreductase (nitroreductase family)